MAASPAEARWAGHAGKTQSCQGAGMCTRRGLRDSFHQHRAWKVSYRLIGDPRRTAAYGRFDMHKHARAHLPARPSSRRIITQPDS